MASRKFSFPSKLLGASLLGQEEIKELTDVINEKSPFRYYGLGKPEKVNTFEKEVKEFLGVKYALGVSSGSAALICAIAALGIGPGDEVIMPAFSWYSDYNAIVLNGASPIFADIDDSLCIDPNDVERKITNRTKAIIVIHYQGGAGNLELLVSIAKKHNLKILEDCAQAFGGKYQDKFLGTYGDVAIASFQNNKIITCGEGGIVYTNDEEVYARAVRYHDLGFIRPFHESQITNQGLLLQEESFAGSQFRMSELQGACILAQFRKLPLILDTCRKHHQKLREYFQKSSQFSIRPHLPGDCGFTLFIDCGTNREATKFAEALEKEGIEIGPTSYCKNIAEDYPIISKRMSHPNLQPFDQHTSKDDKNNQPIEVFSKTNEIANKYVAIGIGVLYQEEHIDYLIEKLKKVEKTLN